MTNIITNIIKFLTGAVSFLYPDTLFFGEIFTNFNYYFTVFVNFLGDVNCFVPLPDIFAAFSIMVSIAVVKFTLFITNWLVKRIFDVIP